jgi:hypothetical protein
MTTTTTALQGLLLGALRDEPRVWSVEELSEAVAEELAERGGAASTVTVTDALDALVEAGLAHRVSSALVSVSRRGLVGKVADTGDALQVSESAGVVGRFTGSDDVEQLTGGAEGLSGGLEPLGARAGGPGE